MRKIHNFLYLLNFVIFVLLLHEDSCFMTQKVLFKEEEGLRTIRFCSDSVLILSAESFVYLCCRVDTRKSHKYKRKCVAINYCSE